MVISAINFIKFKGPFGPLKKAEEEQNELKSNLGEIASGKPIRKDKYQLDTIKNLYHSRLKNIALFNNSAKIRSEAIYKTNQDQVWLKILTPKQMLQRLTVAPVQIKAGNNSESLLNETRQIVYSLHQSKKSQKNIYNN